MVAVVRSLAGGTIYTEALNAFKQHFVLMRLYAPDAVTPTQNETRSPGSDSIRTVFREVLAPDQMCGTFV